MGRIIEPDVPDTTGFSRVVIQFWSYLLILIVCKTPPASAGGDSIS